MLQKDFLDRFKSHNIFIEDLEMKIRLVTFIAGWTDPFAVWIKCYSACWCKYITKVIKGGNIAQQNVRELEVNQLTFSNVKKLVSEENYPRTSKKIFKNYNYLLSNYNFPLYKIKLFWKTLLQKEFGENINFNNRLKRIKSVSFMMSLKKKLHRRSD